MRCSSCLVWAATGPLFHFSNTWQLVINTGTTIVTFLMVFLIQNTQNRDAQAINLKLDELIHSIEGASNQMMDIEKLSDDELNVLHERYEKLRAECLKRNKRARARSRRTLRQLQIYGPMSGSKLQTLTLGPRSSPLLRLFFTHPGRRSVRSDRSAHLTV